MGLTRYRQATRDFPNPTSPGRRFSDNARIKAAAAAKASGLPAFADDSGLAVDALDGATGDLFGAVGRT